MTLRPILLAAAASAALALAAPVRAQDAAAMSKDSAAKVETHIKQLHDQLGITPAEQSQWDQFAQVMRDNATQMHQAFTARAQAASGNAEQNMQSYAEMAQVHAGNMQKLAAAFTTLYDGFPDAQKQTADRVFRERHEEHEKAEAKKGGHPAS